MKKSLSSFPLLLFFFIIAITLSCNKKIEDGNGSTPPTPPANKYPIANAGIDSVIILPKDSVVLDGTKSHDPDGTVGYYYWSKISGPASFLIRDPYLATTVAANLKVGIYLFELYITDNKGSSAKDIVRVTVKPGTGDCGIIELPEINASLIEIGNLSFQQCPYVASAGSKIVFGGGSHGFSDIDIYDAAHHTWQRSQLSQARTNMAVVGCGTKVFFAGGNNWDAWYDIVDIYDASTGSWTVKHLSEPKSFMAAASIGDKVFFAGGITDEGWNQTDIVEIYDISDDAWSISYLTQPKIGAKAVITDNKIYFAGGWNYLTLEGEPLNSVDIYDAVTETWSFSSLNNISGGVAGVQHNNKIFWGGINWSTMEGTIEILNLQNGGVTYDCLSYPRVYPTAVVKNNDIIFFSSGTWLAEDVLSEKFDIYNSITGEKYIGLLNQAISGAAIISVNNTIYVAGGRIGNNTYTDKVYILNW